jgi:hypothetical protein
MNALQRTFKKSSRANRIHLIIKKANGVHSQDIKDGVTDLLADLRHYCDVHGIDFAKQDKVAYQHYIEEKHDEAACQ